MYTPYSLRALGLVECVAVHGIDLVLWVLALQSGIYVTGLAMEVHNTSAFTW